jgi:hypothetical protein
MPRGAFVAAAAAAPAAASRSARDERNVAGVKPSLEPTVL